MPGDLHLTILHTNDLHGRVHQLARIATLVKRIRREVAEAAGQCLYLDAGDSEDTTLIESALTRGSSMNALLRAAGCDQVALGNAIPLRYGPQAVANLAKAFGKPLLCANVYTQQNTILPGTQAFQLLEVENHPVALIGFTAPMDFYPNFFKYPAHDPIALMPGLIEQARAEGAKTIIALTHIGSKNDGELAEKVSGIDLIIGGHDHKQIHPPITVNNTLIAQSGQYGEMLGRLDLVIDRTNGKVIKHTGTLIPVSNEIPEDMDVLKAMEDETARVDTLLNKVIGESLVPLDTSEDAECSAGNLQADAMLAYVKHAQIALTINGHWVNGLQAGSITQKQLYTANRSAGNPALVKLSGAQIRQWLIAALDPENIARKIHPFRGKAVGMPGIAGLTVVAKRSCLHEMQILFGENLLSDEQDYLVAVTDLEISSILNYLVIPDEQAEYEVPTILPEVIEVYIQSHSLIREIPMGRIKILDS
jgi:5'-nucleotidase